VTLRNNFTQFHVTIQSKSSHIKTPEILLFIHLFLAVKKKKKQIKKPMKVLKGLMGYKRERTK